MISEVVSPFFPSQSHAILYRNYVHKLCMPIWGSQSSEIYVRKGCAWHLLVVVWFHYSGTFILRIKMWETSEWQETSGEWKRAMEKGGSIKDYRSKLLWYSIIFSSPKREWVLLSFFRPLFVREKIELSYRKRDNTSTLLDDVAISSRNSTQAHRIVDENRNHHSRAEIRKRICF